MMTTAKLPRVSDTIDRVVVTEIMVSQGDRVEVGAPLVAVAADKVTVEISAQFAGRILEILVDVDDEIETGARLLTMETT